MQYQIVVAPEVGVSPEAFALAWNADAQSSVAAEARVEAQPGASYDPVGISTVVVDLLIGVAGSALYDLVRHVLAQALDQPSAQQRIAIQQIDRPDGTHTLVVTIKQ